MSTATAVRGPNPAAGRRSRHRGGPHAPAYQRGRDGQPDALDGLAGAEEDAPQPGAVLRRHAAAAAVHGDVRLHLRRGDLRQRLELPSAADPRHRRPDGPDHVHVHRRAAARGHGQGRLRSLQVAAHRPDRAAGWPDDRGPGALSHRRQPDLRDGYDHRIPSRRRRTRRAGRRSCWRSSPAGRSPGSSPLSVRSPAALAACRASPC